MPRRSPLVVVAPVVASLLVASVAGPVPMATAHGGCDRPPSHTIAEVNGAGPTGPIRPGQPVTVEGVVTADHRIGGFAGVYVQTVGSGGPRPVAAGVASDGLFVWLGRTSDYPAFGIGDRVQATGAVRDHAGLTELVVTSADGVVACGRAPRPRPVPLRLPASDAERASVESMLVWPTGPFTVSGVSGLGRHGEAVLRAGTGPSVVPTDAFRPHSAEAAALAAANAAARIVLDDGRSAWLEPQDQPPYESRAHPLRVGDRVARFGPTVLSRAFGDWRLQPVLPLDASTPRAARTTFRQTNPRPPRPAPVGGRLHLGFLNVENYFVHFGGLARGAADPAALAKQRAKIASAIRGLGAEVVGLSEVENSVRFSPDRPQLALSLLVAALNRADRSHRWEYVRTPSGLRPAERQDVITTAIIYQPDAVTPVGPSRADDDEQVWSNARPPFAQTFRAGASTFTVVVNHLKSKATRVAASGDNADAGDGQGAYNGDRVRQATSLARFADDLQATSGSPDVALLGDFNAYSHEDPIEVLTDHGLVDVEAALGRGKRSYEFAGESGSLDHALVTPSMRPKITGADIWGINAEESGAFGYAGFGPYFDAGPYRSSDHDPVVIGVGISQAAPAAAPVELQVLAFNDLHGRLASPAVRPAPDGRPIGGVAQLAGIVGRLRAANPNTTVLSAGDNIGASTFVSAVDGDAPTIDVLNAMGVGASALGNHELDRGFADLRDRVVPRAAFPYLGANVFRRGLPALPPYRIQVVGGLRVATIGVVTAETPSLVDPAGIRGLEFRDPVAAANVVAAQLKDGDPRNGEADIVILVAHEGAGPDHLGSPAAVASDPAFGPFVRSSPAIDVVVSGHTHRSYAYEEPVPGAPGVDRPVLQAEDYGVKLGRVTLQFDRQRRRVVHSTVELLDVLGAPEDPAVRAIVDAAQAKAARLGARPVGSITADIRRGTPGGPENEGVESVLGNFVADAQLAATRGPGRGGAQVALTNAGGLRDDLRRGPGGVVTLADAFAVQPFGNHVVTETLTGAQLADAIEQQWQAVGREQRVLWLGISKGLSYSYDPGAPVGRHVRRDTMRLDGRPVGPAQRLRVSVNSFLAGGGDHFTVLARGTGRSSTGIDDLAMLVAFLGADRPVTADTHPRTTAVPPPRGPHRPPQVSG